MQSAFPHVSTHSGFLDVTCRSCGSRASIHFTLSEDDIPQVEVCCHRPKDPCSSATYKLNPHHWYGLEPAPAGHD